MGKNLPCTCKVDFKDPDQLHTFHLIITPDEGLWCGGIYKFQIHVPLDYNNVVSKCCMMIFLDLFVTIHH